MDSEFGFTTSPAWVERFRAEALGEPGQRRFRLVVVVAGETCIIWMEKQQMQALGLAISQILQQSTELGTNLESGQVPGLFDEETSNQFRLGRVELGYVEDDGSIMVNAYDIQEDEGAGFSMRFTRPQARDLITESASLVAAGRPICPMCGQAKDSAVHVCPEQNGYLPLPIDDTYPVDDEE
ncbi:MAG TPA: DUF3090 family protein [Thermomicrobiales bacterium]|nr:DUF3090 family protein [Thermomicrobiales bacterium]